MGIESRRWSRVRERDRIRMLWYLGVGTWNAVFSLFIFYLFLFLMGNNFYQIALLISFILSASQSFLSQSIFVWKSPIRSWKRFTHFFAVASIQYAANALIMLILVSQFPFPPKYCQLSVSFGIAVGSYFYFRTRVFINVSKGALYEEK